METVLILSLVLCLTFQHGYSTLSVYLTAENVQVTIPNGATLSFGDANNGINVTVTSGTLNGTSTMTYWYQKGRVNLVSENTAEYTIMAYGSGTTIRYTGTLVNQVSHALIYGSTVATDSLVFGWDVESVPLLPLMFIIGIVGLFTFVGGLLYMLVKFREGEYEEGLRKGIIFMSLGFGLVWGWLNL